MKSKWMALMAVCLGASVLSGCVDTVDGRHRAGMPFQQDRAEGRYPRPVADLWAAAKDVIKYHGRINSEDVERQSLQGNVDDRHVWISVDAIDDKLSRVIVQARTKGGFADMQMAAYLEKEIAVRLASGNLSPASTPPR
ncbi:MAG TPA: hypothetical protein VFT34_17640 [Verrucomicrobiae bacterium]|nr:hypothetical protein [Verrucomicrobiae bacterium]